MALAPVAISSDLSADVSVLLCQFQGPAVMMDRQQYNAIVRWISRLSFPVDTRELVYRDVNQNTLGSIACHEYVRHTKRTIYQHNKPHIIAKYYKQ